MLLGVNEELRAWNMPGGTRSTSVAVGPVDRSCDAAEHATIEIGRDHRARTDALASEAAALPSAWLNEQAARCSLPIKPETRGPVKLFARRPAPFDLHIEVRDTSSHTRAQPLSLSTEVGDTHACGIDEPTARRDGSIEKQQGVSLQLRVARARDRAAA